MANHGSALQEADELSPCTEAEPRVTRGRRFATKLFSGLILFDVALIGIPLLMLVPLFNLAHLPLRINVFGMAVAFYGGTGVSGVFSAIMLLLMSFPPRQTIGPILARFRKNKGSIVLAPLTFAVLSLVFGIAMGATVTIVCLGAAELLEQKRKTFEATLFDIFVPATFLIVGVTLAFAFNHALVGIRNPQTYDSFFDHMDAVLFHANASQIAHLSLRLLPLGFFKFLELVYYSLYARLTGVLIVCVLLGDRNYAIKYVRAVLVCYAIAVITYSILPAKGPYSTCPLHVSSYPHSLATFWTQAGLVSRAHALWTHNITPGVLSVVSEDYYISFPSLHVALPIIAIWFVRPWKKLYYLLLIAYVFLMLPSVLLLEWHYIVDFFGGFCAASLAIWVTEYVSTARVWSKSLVEVISREPAIWTAPIPLEQTE